MSSDFVPMMAFFVGYAVVFSVSIMFACLCLAVSAKAVNAVIFKWVNEGNNITWAIRFNAWREQQAADTDGRKDGNP